MQTIVLNSPVGYEANGIIRMQTFALDLSRSRNPFPCVHANLTGIVILDRLRGICLFASGGPVEGLLKTPRYHIAAMQYGFKWALKWPPYNAERRQPFRLPYTWLLYNFQKGRVTKALHTNVTSHRPGVLTHGDCFISPPCVFFHLISR